MKKNDWLGLLGIALMLGGLIWVAVRSWPNIGFRYDHPEMTDTQLQIHFLSRMRWLDLVPAGLVLSGLCLMFFTQHKRK